MPESIRSAVAAAWNWQPQDDRILKLFANGPTEYAIVEHPGTDQPRYEVVAFTLERTTRKSLHSTDHLLEAEGVFQQALRTGRTSRSRFPWARWFRSPAAD